VAGLVALIAGFVLPATSSAAGCGLHDAGVLRNLEYGGIHEYGVTLKEGIFEGEPFVPGGAARPRVELLGLPSVLHDLDGDGIEEAAVLLAESSGGSGVFTYLSVLSCRDGRAVNTGTACLGDRVMIRSLGGRDGEVVAEFVAAGPADPLCCPTRKVRNAYRMGDGKLFLASSEDQGPLSVADLEGVAWRLTRLGRDEPVPEGVKVTAVFAGGRISGSGGCNRYSAAVTGNGSLSVAIGPAASTRMSCSDPTGDFERRFFSALQEVNRFGFFLGNLVLHYRKGYAGETMTFER
jgi:heat shock protein HslJ